MELIFIKFDFLKKINKYLKEEKKFFLEKFI
jgi:hypothetical protein